MTDAPNKAVLRLRDAWQQCLRHEHHMSHAWSAIEPTLPLTAAALPLLNDEAVQDWDQFVLRFTKRQDTMVPGFSRPCWTICKCLLRTGPCWTSCTAWKSGATCNRLTNSRSCVLSATGLRWTTLKTMP
ncbi:MAG: hypothetical protein KGZ67_07745 [Hydrogenophaga sp.]|nr:hypothetical protein [Hydrogenophaga sp.]